MQRGTANTRWRDFADIHLLSRRHSIDGDDLRRAIVEVSEFRRSGLTPLTTVLMPELDTDAHRAAWMGEHGCAHQALQVLGAMGGDEL